MVGCTLPPPHPPGAPIKGCPYNGTRAACEVCPYHCRGILYGCPGGVGRVGYTSLPTHHLNL
jgi:hypothetical protein